MPFCACELVACTLQGHVDHAFVWVRRDTADRRPSHRRARNCPRDGYCPIQLRSSIFRRDRLTYRETVQVLKKGRMGWWRRRTARTRRRDNCWDEEGWPFRLCDGDLYAQKNPSKDGRGARRETHWETGTVLV